MSGTTRSPSVPAISRPSKFLTTARSSSPLQRNQDEGGNPTFCSTKTPMRYPTNLKRHVKSHEVNGVRVKVHQAKKGGLTLDKNEAVETHYILVRNKILNKDIRPITFQAPLRSANPTQVIQKAPRRSASPSQASPTPRRDVLLVMPVTKGKKTEPPHPKLTEMMKMVGQKGPCAACKAAGPKGTRLCSKARTRVCTTWAKFAVSRDEPPMEEESSEELSDVNLDEVSGDGEN
ncbi:hypothetical protein B0T25DRAFT_542019 [Lasiosphaeria hispida]|uniref:Uncharacterized protein n=1 Tax=Lasiosphaeria hispida TaxID=260671 RepID=A0AAJ0MDG5_9PEZI|nr:hypothetical protein B0T25DRAFT_542019 [Lasiosphaeria hispida]